MTDDRDAIDAQQRSAARFVVLEPLGQVVKCLHRQSLLGIQSPENLGRDRLQHHLGQTFGRFEQHVANEAFADHDIGGPGVQVAPLNVSEESVAEDALREELVRLTDDIRPLTVLTANVH